MFVDLPSSRSIARYNPPAGPPAGANVPAAPVRGVAARRPAAGRHLTAAAPQDSCPLGDAAGDVDRMPSKDPQPGEDRVRAELRALGYLENPLSRFFVGGLSGQRPMLRTHLRSGVGVGVVLGALVSALVLVALLAQPHGPSPLREGGAVLLLVAAALAFGACVAVGLVGAVAIFVVFRLTRRLVDKAELAARISGVAAAALVFLYLVLFWGHYGPGLAAGAAISAPAAHVAAAVGVVLIAALTLRVFHLATFAVVASIPGYHVGMRRGARRALMISVALVATVTASAAFLTGPAEEQRFAEHGEAFTAGPGVADRVVLIAIDGLDRVDFEAAIERGWMPRAAALAEDGALRPLATGDAAIPPSFWTTVATGMSVRRHQIDSYLRDRVRGVDRTFDLAGVFSLVLSALGLSEEVIVSGSMSRVKRVRDVAVDAGKSAVSVNYWATWPSDGSAGLCVSERAWLDMVLGGGDPRAMSPELRARLEALVVREDALAAEVPEVAQAGLLGNHATARPILNDLFVQRAALRLLEDERPDYLQVGLTGLDILRNEFRQAWSRSADVRMAGRLEVLEAWYRRLDAFLDRVRSAAGDRALLCVATYPGISARSTDAQGVLLLHGPGVRAWREDVPIAPESLAPTLQFCLGLPASEEQDGAPDLAAFSREALASAAGTKRMVASFGLKPPAPTPDSSSSVYREWLEQSGYLGSSRSP